jgi:hypothetical protein
MTHLPHARSVESGRSPRAALVGGCCALLLAPCAAHAEFEFKPVLAASVSYVDNVDLVDTGEEDALVLEAKPEFVTTYKSERVNGRLDYRLTSLTFDDSDRNQVYHEADGSATFDIIQRWFSTDIGGRYLQRTIDPERPVNSSFMFDTANLTDVGTYNVAPRLLHEFRTFVVDASYNRAWVKFKDIDPLTPTTVEDTENEQTAFALHSRDDNPNRFTWALRYSRERALYKISRDFEYETAGVELGYRATARTRLFVSGGAESDLAQNLLRGEDGGLDQNWWEVGTEVQLNRFNHFLVAVGDKFYGRSYRVAWDREARVLSLHLGYNEQPVTVAQEIAFRPHITSSDVVALPEEDLARLTNDIYLLRAFDGNVSLKGRRTRLALTVRQERRRYFLTDLEDRERTVEFGGQRTLSPRLTLSGAFTISRLDLRGGAGFDQKMLTLGLDRLIGQKASISLELSRNERSSGIQPFQVNWATVTFRKEF